MLLLQACNTMLASTAASADPTRFDKGMGRARSTTYALPQSGQGPQAESARGALVADPAEKE